MRVLMRRLPTLIALGALAVPCAAPVIAGRWQVADTDKVDGETMSPSASMPGTGTLALTLTRQPSR